MVWVSECTGSLPGLWAWPGQECARLQGNPARCGSGWAGIWRRGKGPPSLGAGAVSSGGRFVQRLSCLCPKLSARTPTTLVYTGGAQGPVAFWTEGRMPGEWVGAAPTVWLSSSFFSAGLSVCEAAFLLDIGRKRHRSAP